MFVPTKMLRRSMWLVSVALALSGLTLYLLHTGPVRHFVLTRIQAYLRETRGLLLQVGDFDYNLASSKVEFKEVALNGIPSESEPPSLMARHIVVTIPAWRAALGSFENAQIWIDGLAVNWTSSENRATNWPAMDGAKGGSMSHLPTISAVNCELNLQDRGSGASIHLPNARLSVAWSPAKSENSITFGSSSGSMRWNQTHLALDQVQLKSAFTSSGFSLSSLQVVSGASKAEISGTATGSPNWIEGRGTLDADLQELSGPLGFADPAQGRIKVELSANGPMRSVEVRGQLSSDRMTLHRTPISDAKAAAVLDTATGRLQISHLSAQVFSGYVTGKGDIRTKKDEPRSEFAVRLSNIDARQVARTIGFVIHYVPRATVDVSASWPALEWRRASLAGSARSLSAKLNFRSGCDPKSIRASLQAALGAEVTTEGNIALTFPAHALSGKFTGDITSLGAVTRELQPFVLQNRYNLLEQPLMDGAAHWSATLRGTLELPSASVQATVNGLSSGNWKNADVRVNANVGAAGVEIERARLDWSRQHIEMNGRVGGLSADAPLHLEGNVEGSSLGAVLENLGFSRLAEGSVSGAIHVGGSVARPAVETTLNLGDLTLLGERFVRTIVDAQWQNSELKINRFQAEHDAGSGTPGLLNANGSLDISTRQYAFSMMGQGLRPTASSWHPITGTFSVEAHGAGTFDNPTLSARARGDDVRIGEVTVGELRGEA